MLKTAAFRYMVFIAFTAISLIGLMFTLEPKMILPSIIGLVLFTATIVLFFKIVSRKSEAEQKLIAIRNGKVASVLVVVLLAAFFIAAAKHNHMPVWDLVKLWFSF